MILRFSLIALALASSNCLTQKVWRMASPETNYDHYTARDVTRMTTSRGNNYVELNYATSNAPARRALFNVVEDKLSSQAIEKVPIYMYGFPKDAAEFCPPGCEKIPFNTRVFSAQEIALPYQNAILHFVPKSRSATKLHMADFGALGSDWGRPIEISRVSIDAAEKYFLFEYVDGESQIFQILENDRIVLKGYGALDQKTWTQLAVTQFDFTGGVLVIIKGEVTWIKSDAVKLTKLHILNDPPTLRAPSARQDKGDPWAYVSLPLAITADIILSPLYLISHLVLPNGRTPLG